MKSVLKILFLLTFAFSCHARAVGEPYTQQKLDALNKSGQPVLVFVHAGWCSTCRAQDKVLGELLPLSEFKPITVLKVDFDTQKPVVRALGVQYQSTLIVFRGGKEVSRMTGETDRDRIADLLRKVL